MRSPHNRQVRLTLTAIGLIALFSLLIVGYWRLQVQQHPKWLALAKRQHYFSVNEPFSRGILFSSGIPLVQEVTRFHLQADCRALPETDKQEIAKELASRSTLKELEIYEELQQNSRNRRLCSWLTKTEREKINAWWHGFRQGKRIARNALFFQADYLRVYPHGHLAGQVLHTVQRLRDESTGKAFPTGGVELTLDAVLCGERGKRLLLRSPRNAFALGSLVSAPIDGQDVTLTLDIALQAILEEELEKGVRAREAKGGFALLMDPHTGKILAMAHYPFFSPADYPDYFADEEGIERTKPKAVTDANEPGSVMKPLTASLALLANQELRARGEPPLFDPEQPIDVSSGRFPGRKRPLSEVVQHKKLTLNMAMQRSANIYFAILAQRIVERMGEKWYRNALSELFGLERLTGVELPGESPGLLPNPSRYHANGRPEWSRSTPYSLAIGHNVQMTALQIGRAYAVLANGGYLVTPTLIERISDYPPAEPRKHYVLDSAITQRINEAVTYVSIGKRGDIPGYSQIGKSGTAEKIIDGAYSKELHLANFVGFFPAREPRFVLVVCIDEPKKRVYPGLGRAHFGGFASALVFREVALRTLAYSQIPPDDPERTFWKEETRALNQTYRKWHKR